MSSRRRPTGPATIITPNRPAPKVAMRRRLGVGPYRFAIAGAPPLRTPPGANGPWTLIIGFQRPSAFGGVKGQSPLDRIFPVKTAGLHSSRGNGSDNATVAGLSPGPGVVLAARGAVQDGERIFALQSRQPPAPALDGVAQRLRPARRDQVLVPSWRRWRRNVDFVGDSPKQGRRETFFRRAVRVGLVDAVGHGLGQIGKPYEVTAILTLLEPTRICKRSSRHALPPILTRHCLYRLRF